MMKLLLPILIITCCAIACKQPLSYTSPAGYDFSQPERLSMAVRLNEISGIAFKAGDPVTLYAIQDEEGILFHFSVKGMEDLQQFKFGRRGDYEDLAFLRGNWYVLRSDGVIFSFAENAMYGGPVQEWKHLLPPGEYESLYAVEDGGLLYVLCKHCKENEGGKIIKGYVLQCKPNNELVWKEDFSIPTAGIAARLGKNKIDFRPSAMAKNESSHHWYMLSAINKLLLITDEQWRVLDIVTLDPTQFPQAEGMAFDRYQNLYISNERRLPSPANILKFTFARVK